MKIRMAVVINDHGHWNALGYYKWDDKKTIEIAKEGLAEISDCEAVHFIEAEVPVPKSEIISGTIMKDRL